MKVFAILALFLSAVFAVSDEDVIVARVLDALSQGFQFYHFFFHIFF